jgi:hypothetical protein
MVKRIAPALNGFALLDPASLRDIKEALS